MMSPVDGVLLASLLGAGACRLAWPARWRAAGPWICLALGALASVQIVWLGFTWQFAGGYLLLVALVLGSCGAKPGIRPVEAAGLSALMLLTLAPWVILPAPDLPRPRGPYPVGSAVYRWVDASRREAAKPDIAEPRHVIAQAWYPAAASRGREVGYMDGVARLPPAVYGLPRFIFRRFGQTKTHAVFDAPIATARAAWPVVIFSPGYGAPRAVYGGLVADLASRGYVVIALDHPYESAVVQLADGRVVGPAPLEALADREGVRHMDRQVVVRSADVRFVLDRLTRGDGLGPLAGRLDLARIAAVGHSFGGATAVLAASGDPRIRAAADVDGMLYGDVRGANLSGPLLLLESAATHRIEPYVRATRAVLEDAPAGGWRYVIARSSHLSFTDAERFLSAPARWVAARVMRGERGASDTQAVAVDILDAFLRPPLRGEAGDVAAAAGRHDHVYGGREP